jgi:hypothetical protein
MSPAILKTGWTRFLDVRGCNEMPSADELFAAFTDGVNARRSLAREDTLVRHEWGVDWNNDFVYETFGTNHGTLYVPGGEDACQNWVNMIMDEVHEITMLTKSSDLHHPFQIFFSPLWKYGQQYPTKSLRGQYVKPSNFATGEITLIPYEDVRKGFFEPVHDPKWQVFYVKTLGINASKVLVIWPWHCMEGTWGQAFAPAVQVASAYWEGARGARAMNWFKAFFWGAEMYSPQEAEVKHPEDPNAEIVGIYDDLELADQTGVGGLARSHCVFEFLKKNLNRFKDRRPEVLQKMIVRNRMSAAIPGYDKEIAALDQELIAAGVTIEN